MLRDTLEDGLATQGDFEQGLLRHANVVGSLAVIKQLTDLDYDGLVSGLEG